MYECYENVDIIINILNYLYCALQVMRTRHIFAFSNIITTNKIIEFGE